jgi:hypothetical protein
MKQRRRISMQQLFDSGLALAGLVVVIAAAALLWRWINREPR